jgi:tetratricopeptide (TPR) repeat protein
LVSTQYVHAHRSSGREALAAGNTEEALRHFEAARHYPQNLGEGKHLLTLERDLDYFSAVAAQRRGDADLARRYFTAAAAPLPSPGTHSYFRALALRALGQVDEASRVLSRLAEFAAKRMKSHPKLDYFATSLPNMLLFNDDLDKRNRIEALVLSALASHGFGDEDKAVRLLQEVVAEDPNHLFALETLCWLRREERAAPQQIEAYPAP